MNLVLYSGSKCVQGGGRGSKKPENLRTYLMDGPLHGVKGEKFKRTIIFQLVKSVCMAPKSCQGNLLDDGGGNELVRVKYYACHSFSSPRPPAMHLVAIRI